MGADHLARRKAAGVELEVQVYPGASLFKPNTVERAVNGS